MDPTNFEDCKALAETRRRKLANNTYLECNDDGSFGIRLHSTQVVVYHEDGRIVLDSGGWQTVTTKARMNSFSNASLWQDKGIWYVSGPYAASPGGDWRARQANASTFADGITFFPDGTVTGEGEDPKAQQKERKAAAQYAKDYVEALAAGKVPAPGGGDCWGCLMVATDGSHPMGGRDHMLSHMSKEERYYVPSIAVNAAKRFGVSRACQQWLASRWDNAVPNPGEWLGGIASDQIRKAIKRWVLAELGHPV